MSWAPSARADSIDTQSNAMLAIAAQIALLMTSFFLWWWLL
jgi:hypothetical protein